MTEDNKRLPDFNLEGDDNQTYTLDSFKDQKIVLYFYPRDNTPGCTKEAIEFNELKDQFTELGVKIVGISKDSLKSHNNFKEKHKFTHLLLSDPEISMMKEYGVYGEKKMYGKTSMGVIRTTIIVDENGNQIKRFNNVKASGHAQRILDYIKSLN